MKKFSTLVLSMIMLAGSISALVACGGGSSKTYYDNEVHPLVLSISEPEGVFSPFFSSAAYDSEIAGQTQISMLSADRNGEVAFGVDQPVVTLDYSVRMFDAAGNLTTKGDVNGTSVYQFVLKKDLVFSDNTPLTIRDVLFNYYVLLDPVYTGLSTIYSTKIKGLLEYRTQDENITEAGNEDLEKQFANEGQERINNIKNFLAGGTSGTAQITKDLETAKKEFRKELESDWLNSMGQVQEMQKQGFPFTEDWEVYMYNVGIITHDVDPNTYAAKKDATGTYIMLYNDIHGIMQNGYDGVFSRQNCIDVAFIKHFPNANPSPTHPFISVLTYWNTGRTTLPTVFAAEAKSDYYKALKEQYGMLVWNIEGLKAKSGSQFVPSSHSNSSVSYASDYEMLEITIDGVDPKAIWNFGITVAPMHYYSDAAHVQAAKADTTYSRHFGVEYSDYPWYQQVVQAKNSIPLGAGPYMMSTATGASGKTEAQFRDGFYKDGMVYFERNPHFMLGAPVIKNLRYKVLNSANILNSLTEQAIHYATPQAKQDNIDVVDKRNYLDRTMVKTNGYGYIGISAKHIPEIGVRRALMTAIDPSYVKDYYPGSLCELIQRPMSTVSWVYKDVDQDGNETMWAPESKYFVPRDSASNDKLRKETIDAYLKSEGYTKDAGSGKYKNSSKNKTLKYTFNVAGDTPDHPAWMVFEKAAEWLNANGWEITVRSNSRTLTLLGAGEGLEVWAAAWSSTIDPDMYQVYHKDSKAASIKNWGYDWMWTQRQGSTEEQTIIKNLSDLIDAGRETIDQAERTVIYRDALELIMNLAVELPLYQRNDMYVYNTNVIDASTLISKNDCTPYCSPLNEIWNVSLVTKK